MKKYILISLSVLIVGCGSGEKGDQLKTQSDTKETRLFIGNTWDGCTVPNAACYAGIAAETAKMESWIHKATNEWPALCDAGNPEQKAICLQKLQLGKTHMQAAKLKFAAHSSRVTGAQNTLVAMVNKANLLGLALGFRAAIPAADRLELASLSAQLKDAFTHAYEKWYFTVSDVETVRQGVAHALLVVPTELAGALEHSLINSYKLLMYNPYERCATDTAGTIMGAIASDMVINFLDLFGNRLLSLNSDPGLSHILNTHPVSHFNPQNIDLSGSQRKESAGKVSRTLFIGWKVPADAIWTQNVYSPISGALLIPAGTSLTVKEHYLDNYPSFYVDQAAQKFVTNSRGLAIHYSEPNGPNPSAKLVCLAIGGEEISPGEQASCDFSLDVTGSPAEVASGATASKRIHLYAQGGNDSSTTNDKYFKFDITYNAPKEAPQDPCYVWNSSLQKYVFVPGCGIGGGGVGGKDSGL